MPQLKSKYTHTRIDGSWLNRKYVWYSFSDTLFSLLAFAWMWLNIIDRTQLLVQVRKLRLLVGFLSTFNNKRLWLAVFDVFCQMSSAKCHFHRANTPNIYSYTFYNTDTESYRVRFIPICCCCFHISAIFNSIEYKLYGKIELRTELFHFDTCLWINRKFRIAMSFAGG